MSAPFRHRLRVRWSECDLQGVVFYPHYLAYFDVALTELWREAVIPYTQMQKEGADMVVGEAKIRYLHSARFDDELDLVVTVTRLGTTSTTTTISIERVGDGKLLVEAELRHVFVDPRTMQKRDIPDSIRAGLGRFVAMPA